MSNTIDPSYIPIHYIVSDNVCTIELQNTTFSNNNVSSFFSINGADAAAMNTSCTFIFHNTSFDGNVATSLFNDNTSTGANQAPINYTVILQNSSFDNNVMSYLFNFSSFIYDNSRSNQTVSFDNCSFMNNNVSRIVQLDCNGQYCYQTLNISNSSFVFNQSGGVLEVNTSQYANLSLWITDSNFNSTKTANGGVLSLVAKTSSVNITIERSTFNQTAAENGSVLWIEVPQSGMNLTVTNSTFNYSQATNGGVLWINALNGSGMNLTVTNSTFNYSQAAENGGVLWINALNGSGVNLTVYNSTFNHSQATNGGVLWIQTPQSSVNLTVIHSNFNYSHASLDGGTIYVGDCQLNMTLIYNAWDGNQAENDGGCIYLADLEGESNSIHVKDNTIVGNKAQNNGGFLAVISDPTVNMAMAYNTVNDSTATNGGVIYIYLNNQAANHIFNLSTNYFFSNNATEGAVIYSNGLANKTFNLKDNQLSGHNTTIIYISSQYYFVNSTNNRYTNNTNTQATILGFIQGEFISLHDRISNSSGIWLYISGESTTNTDHTAHISHLQAFDLQSWQLLTMDGLNGNQTVSLLNVSITGSLNTVSPSLVSMQVSGDSLPVSHQQTLFVNDSVISNITGCLFNMSAMEINGTQLMQIRNTTMKQLVTSGLGVFFLNSTMNHTLEQSVEWVESTWEACQGTLLWANNMTKLNVTNCQFNQSTASNGPLFAIASNLSGNNATFTSNQFLQNQAAGAVIQCNGTTYLHFVNHTVVDNTPLHLWVTDDTSSVDFADVYANYSSSTSLLAKWETIEATLGQLELTLLNDIWNVTFLNYAATPQPWSSAIVKRVNKTTSGECFYGHVSYDQTQAIAQYLPCPALDIPPDITGNVTVTGIVALYPNQTLNISSGVHILVEEGGCLMLQGGLHLRLDESVLPNSETVLIQGCFGGEFGNVSFDNTNNPHICQVSPIYASSQVMMNLQACDDAVVVPVGAIVGGVIGGVVFLALMVIIILFLVRRHAQNQLENELESKLDGDRHKRNRRTLGPDAISNPNYTSEGRSGENAIYE